MALDVYKDWLGIPDGPRPPDHYALLRLVRFEDDDDKIRNNYKKLNGLIRKYATGKYSIPSQELLNEIAKAMLCLTDPVRKRAFDESLGREFEDETSQTGHQLLQNWLRDQGHISTEQAMEVEHFAEARGLSIRDAVVQMKMVDAEMAAKALAVELGVAHVDLSVMLPDDSVLDKVTRNTVKRNSILPLFVDDDCLLVACVDEPTHELEDELRMIFGVSMRRVIATPLSINQGIAKYYAPGMRDESVSAIAVETAAKPKKDKAKKKGQAVAKKTSGPKLSAPKSDEEKQKRKQLGWLMMGWGFIASVLIDQFVIGSYFPNLLFLGFLSAYIVTPAVVLYVIKVYWK